MVTYRPKWYYGNVVASPAAGTALVSFTVPKGYVGYIFGFSLSLSDSSGNQFYINWTSNGVRQSSAQRFMHATQHRPNSSSMRAPLCVDKSIRPSADPPTGSIYERLDGG